MKTSHITHKGNIDYGTVVGKLQEAERAQTVIDRQKIYRPKKGDIVLIKKFGPESFEAIYNGNGPFIVRIQSDSKLHFLLSTKGERRAIIRFRAYILRGASDCFNKHLAVETTCELKSCKPHIQAKNAWQFIQAV